MVRSSGSPRRSATCGETAFERIHNVRHDPAGYNVAHTPVELKPHTDLPSYHWPPSIQLLHFVVNDAIGGESTVTDGWAVVADLRRQDPEAFETLCRVPVTYQLYSHDEDTYATAPMIQLDHRRRSTNRSASPTSSPSPSAPPSRRSAPSTPPTAHWVR